MPLNGACPDSKQQSAQFLHVTAEPQQNHLRMTNINYRKAVFISSVIGHFKKCPPYSSTAG